MKTKKQTTAKVVLNFFKTIGVCAGAYLVLCLISNLNYEAPKKKIDFSKYKDKDTDEILEAKIDS